MTIKIFDTPDSYSWREVFAWWPVKTVGGKYVWLKKIYKQRYWGTYGEGIAGNFHIEPYVEYGDLFDVMKEADDKTTTIIQRDQG